MREQQKITRFTLKTKKLPQYVFSETTKWDSKMSINDDVKAVGDGATALAKTIDIIKDNENAKQAADNLGQSLVTITETIKNALLPLAAVNYGFNKAKTYFNEKFQQDFEPKLADIPPEDLIEPKASVAGAVLQGIAFAHEETDIKEMFLSLLATSMDKRVSANAHPAFVEIIKQLSNEEAKLVQNIFSLGDSMVATAEIRLHDNVGFKVIYTHLVNFQTTDGAMLENPRLPAIIDNLVRLGLIIVDYSSHLTDENAYQWVNDRPEMIRFKKEFNPEKIQFQKGVIKNTSFGVQFAKAVGLTS